MQWFENETFWEALYPYMFGEARWAGAPAEVDRVLALSGVTSGRVLDLCCGPARHSSILAQRGFEVTGVDRSDFLLAKARALAPTGVELVQCDMRDFVRPGAFDLVLSLFTSFGYFETREEDLAVLHNIYKSLKPGGVLLMDVISKEYVISQRSPTRWEQLPGGVLIQHYDVFPGWGRLRVEWLLVEGERARHFEFAHNLYSGQELAALLATAGFGEVQLFGSLDGGPYDAAATRLVVRAVAGDQKR
ncbi:MAG TPA: methyltransferase domain-containing protein [Bryobacteraceae bacterium]|nr:methyltransferase domain-containing protein [Bryobacteraceae bacterium]